MSDPDVQRAFATLRLLVEACSASLDALQQPLAAIPTSSSSPSHAVLYKDYNSLLSLAYTSTTKLALTLRPSELAWSAALTPLRDLAGNVTALTTCATLFDAHGLTLAAEVRVATGDICEALRALARTFLDEGGVDYLVRTGAVHDTVEKARGVSASNLAAVRRRWALDKDLLDDVLTEIAGMIEDGDGDGEVQRDDDFDDEWDELGLGSNKKMSRAEVERTKEIQPLLRFTTLLHKRILLDILTASPPTGTSEVPNTVLDSLPAHSYSIVLASEEVIAALYAPQNLSVLASATSSLASTVDRFRAELVNNALLPPPRVVDVEEVTNQVSTLAMSTGAAGRNVKSGGQQGKDIRKWFDTCFLQIDKLCKLLSSTLGALNET